MRRESGQALVIVLLSLAVVLTLVLFVLARSTTDIAVSSRSEEATRAFSAAEAGVESSLVIGAGGVGSFENASYKANVTNFAEGQTEFNYPTQLMSGDSMTLWFTGHDADGNTVCNATDKRCFTGSQIKVCWGNAGTDPGSGTTPAIEGNIFYEATPGNRGTVKIARLTADPYGGRNPANNFSSPDGGGCTIGGVAYSFQKTISFSAFGIPASVYGTANGLQFARFRIFYNSDVAHAIGVTEAGCSDCIAFPSQGLDILSTGTAGESNRSVKVFQSWPEAPSVFDYAIYSGTGLTK